LPLKIHSGDNQFSKFFDELLKDRISADTEISAAVSEIIKAVRNGGDNAVIRLTKKFDGLDLSKLGMRVSLAEINEAKAAVGTKELDALKHAAERIESFHLSQIPNDIDYRDDQGVDLRLQWQALDSVGLYVPGGTASYPSSVLMNAIPARVAGVERRVITVPGTREKGISPMVLAAADIAGVKEIYRIGGAQAIAALAFGTETIVAVDKIVGPGNSYVAAAKRMVYGRVGIDSIAGPSEVLIVADASNNPQWIACDLMAQAEHDEMAQAILITDDDSFATKVLHSVFDELESLERSSIARKSWENHGAIIVVKSLQEAPSLINQLAPEHLQLAVDDPETLMKNVRHAGAVFLGRYTPEAVGDYVAGPNHVLPTNRTARFSSGLSALDYLKRTTIVGCSRESLMKIGPSAVVLAEAEGLQAHAKSIKMRLVEKK
tara:strand:- start:671 stop:1972 length:1302 start_codon:yes stop_codon:yes gene_type:complete